MTLIALALAIPWFGAVVLVLADGRRRVPATAALLLLAATVGTLGLLTARVLADGPQTVVAGNWPAGVGIVLRADALGVTFALLSAAVIAIALLCETLRGIQSRSFPALALFLTAGLTGLFLTGDAFNFYVFFEIAMITSYVLTGYGEGRRQLRAAASFAVVNLLGSVLFLIAIAGLYHLTGRLDMAGIAARMTTAESQSSLLLGTLIFVAFSVKLGLFPFHFWLATVYTGTRPAVAAILSGALANIGSYGLLRFGGDILPFELRDTATALLLLGSLSLIYGALQAMSRRTVPEVLAYSTIGQVGYMIVALGLASLLGFEAVVLFAIVNALNKTLLFLAEDLRGWLAGAIFVTGALSVAGLPPTAGFLGKAAIVRATLADGGAWLVALILLGSLLSLIYMVQIYQRRFWATPAGQTDAASPLSIRLLLGLLALAILFFGIWPDPLLRLSRDAAAVLLGGSM